MVGNRTKQQMMENKIEQEKQCAQEKGTETYITNSCRAATLINKE